MALWRLLVPLSLVSGATYDFAWDARQLQYTCDGLKEATGKEWISNGDFCVHFSDDRYTWSEASDICTKPSFASSNALSSLSWLQLRLLPDSDVGKQYWTALRSQDTETILDGPISTSIYNPSWADSEPISIDDDACILIDLSSTSSKNRGWHFNDCSTALPVVCQTFACINDEFRCADNTRCIPRTAVNDGFEDCLDGSDEYTSAKSSILSSLLNVSRADRFLAPAVASSTLPPKNNDASANSDCPLPQDLRDVQIAFVQGYKFDDTINWKCNSGFSPQNLEVSLCVKGGVWQPAIECNKMNCNEPETTNLTSLSGTFHGDRATYETRASVINNELARVAVCDEGTWVYMNDELNDYCIAEPFMYGHFDQDKFEIDEIMASTCEKDFSLSFSPVKCRGDYRVPSCLPDQVKPSDCDGTVQTGPPLFARDWCACKDGGMKQDGECKSFTDSCNEDQDTCSVGKTCQRNETAGEDWHCACPFGSCLYPFDYCDRQAFLPDDSFDKNMGECATIRCSIDDLVPLVDSNCRIATYETATSQVDLRLGTTDVFCTHDLVSGKIQTRHSVECVDGVWEGAEFNLQCNATPGLVFDRVEFDAFATTSVRYPDPYPATYMTIRCNGNGEWMGEVPPDTCVNGSLQMEENLVRCICNDGYFGVDCSSPCDHGTPRGDGTCECSSGYRGQYCEVTETCFDAQPTKPAYGERIALVFIIDLYMAGFDQFVTNAETGLISSVQQLIRDISYYDKQFINNITVITFGADVSDPISFTWDDAGNFVSYISGLQSQVDKTCTSELFGGVMNKIDPILSTFPRGSIINMFTVQPAQSMDESIVDAFVSNGLISNIITDSTAIVSGCKSSGGIYDYYRRLTKLTNGYFFDGFPVASFMQILPRFYKSSIVLIPAVMKTDDDKASFPIILDSAAQSIIAYSYDGSGRNEPYSVVGKTSPKLLQFNKPKHTVDVLYNTGSPSGWTYRNNMDGYFFYELGSMDWQSAVSSCDSMGGTVADFLTADGCPGGTSYYWLPIRGNPLDSTYGWQATYRGTKVPVISPRWEIPPPPPSNTDCVAYSCTSNKWFIANSCDEALTVLCQRSVFDPSQTDSSPTDAIRSDATFVLTAPNLHDPNTFYSIRVQSTVAFDYKLVDTVGSQELRIESGKTHLRMASSTGAGLPDSSQWARYAQVVEDASLARSPAQQTSCTSFPMTTAPLFCSVSGDVTVQILNREGVVRSFITRCLESLSPEFQPPPDCASTGCIPENTGYCYVDEKRQYKCSCRKGFSGLFCEVNEYEKEYCAANLVTQINDVKAGSTIIQSGCGCTEFMDECSFNRVDGCNGQCQMGNCAYTDVIDSTPKPGQPKRAIAACKCNNPYTGEFCDRKQAPDCAGNPCHNGAQCEQTVDPTGYKCHCAAGFSGTYCDIPLGLCTDATCENGGTCFNLDPLSTFCLCRNGFAGDRCERLLDLGCFNGGQQLYPGGPCQCQLAWEGQYCTVLKDPMPLEVCGCSNGATCVYDVKQGKAQISCKCPEFWVGPKCDTLQLPCDLAPCVHGTCIAQPNEHEYKCKCDKDYGGDICDVFVGDDGCQEDSCLNGGTCKGGVCDCPKPYSGSHCQTTGYCLNGGTCDVVNEKPVCQCTLQYTGKQCTEPNNDNSYNLRISASTQQLGFEMTDLDPIFSVCAWIRATPRASQKDPVMPIFEITFGSTDKLRVTTAKATIKGVSVGALNLKMQIWQQFCVRCTGSNCSAIANGDPMGINLIGGFSHSSTDLIIAPLPANGEVMLNAEISRLSIYNRVISDKEVAAFTFECSTTVNTDATAEYVWWGILQAAPRSALVSPGLCESSPCWPGTCDGPVDKTPPMATYCPPDQFMTSLRPKSITWDEPVFEDDQKVLKIDSNYRSGDIFVWGEHHVVYTATDPSNNTGRCEFDIYFAPNDCKAPMKPFRGDVVPKETFDGESGSKSMVSVKCEDERYPKDGPKFYICDYMGQWRRSYYSPTFLPPSCGKVKDPEQTMDGSVHFNAADYNCADERKKIEDTINSVLTRICPDGHTDGCAQAIISDCPMHANREARADDIDEPTLTYEIIILDPSITDDVYQDVQTELDNLPDVAGQSLNEQYRCGDDTPLKFQSGDDTLCAEVPPGFYFSNAAKFACPINQYQDESNQGQCKSCPDGTITESEGATKPEDCYQNCPPGQWCDFNTLGAQGPSGAFEHCCVPCDKGRFASGMGSLQCQDCKDGMTTQGTGTTLESECYWPCVKGQEMNMDTETCRDCEQGKYKDTDQAGQCKSCVTGLTTAGTKSTVLSDCSLLYCPVNTYVNPDAKGGINPNTFKLDDYCLPCEKGMYQPKPNSTSCDKCPNTPDINADDLPATCRMENECSPKLDNSCGGGMKCLKWPDNAYYHCVQDNSEQQEDGSSLVWWQIILIVAGSCLGVAVIIAVAVIVAMKCCNLGKKVPKETDSFSQERRTTGDNYGTTVPDKDEVNCHGYQDLPTPMIEMPPVHVDPSYVYNKDISLPPTPAAEQLPMEYQRAPPIATAAVVRMRKRQSNVSKDNVPRQSRPFSTDTISSVPSLRLPAGRASGNYFVPSVTIRSNSESSLDSFSIGSVSSRGSSRPRVRPDSSQIVHALIDALDEDRFRGGWDKESSIL